MNTTGSHATTIAAMAALMVACGGTSNTPSDGGGVDAPPGVDVASDTGAVDAAADASTTGARLVVRVFALEPGSMGVPLADAQVAFERPGGGREERVTDASGAAIFTGIDWAMGRGAVTAWRAGRVAASVTNLDGRRAEVELGLVALPPSVHLRGRVTNAAMGATQFLVQATTGMAAASSGANFDVEVPRGVAFRLVVAQASDAVGLSSGRGFAQPVLRWSELEHAALTADAREDLDLAATRPLTPTPFSVRLEPSAAIASELSSNYVGISVVLASRGGNVSMVTRTNAANMAGPVEITGEYVRPTGVTHIVRQHVILADGSAGGRTHVVVEEGSPPSSATVSNFLPVPQLGDVPFPLMPHATIPVRARAGDVPLGAVMFRGGAYVWHLTVDGDGSSVTFPALPSRAAADPTFGAGDYEVRVRSCEGGPRDLYCRRAAVAERLELSGRP